jgi:hypothetical protein
VRHSVQTRVSRHTLQVYHQNHHATSFCKGFALCISILSKYISSFDQFVLMIACKFYARGACTFGDACRNSHDLSLTRTKAAETWRTTPHRLDPATESASVEDTRSRIICRFYNKGQCLKSDSCPFAHPDRQHTTEASKLEQDHVPVRDLQQYEQHLIFV